MAKRYATLLIFVVMVVVLLILLIYLNAISTTRYVSVVALVGNSNNTLVWYDYAGTAEPYIPNTHQIVCTYINAPSEERCDGRVVMFPLTTTTQSTIPVYSNQTILNVDQEINISRSYGFNFSLNMFYASSASQCNLELTAPCDNNVPSQFVCLNGMGVASYSAQRPLVYPNDKYACPQYYMMGHIGCALVNNYCVVADYKG